MAQLTIYLPEDLLDEIKREASRAGKSVSAFLADIASAQLRPRKPSKELRALYGSWKGSFPELEDAPPKERDSL